MSINLVWSNFVAYSLQIGLLVGVAALAPAALRLRSPRARLAYWHLLLVACLLLPMIRPWRQQVIADTVTVTTRVIAIAPADTPQTRTFSRTEIALAVIVLGALCRLGVELPVHECAHRGAQVTAEPAHHVGIATGSTGPE